MLRNKLGLTDAALLARVEDALTARNLARYEDKPVTPATFDWAHLSQIHARLFGELYPWAGQARTVDMAKGSAGAFESHSLVRERVDELGAILQANGLLRGMAEKDFVQIGATAYNALNQIHPFREGNGRTQRVYMDDLARGAGWQLDWTQVRGPVNDHACEQARLGDDTDLRALFGRITSPAPPDPQVWTAAQSAALGLTSPRSYDPAAPSATTGPPAKKPGPADSRSQRRPGPGSR